MTEKKVHLLIDEETDTTIETKTDTFHVRRFILIKHSAVWASLASTVKDQHLLIPIEDYDPKVVHELLKFIHAPSYSPYYFPDANIVGVLDLAFKYDIKSVCEYCESKIKATFEKNTNHGAVLTDYHKLIAKYKLETCRSIFPSSYVKNITSDSKEDITSMISKIEEKDKDKLLILLTEKVKELRTDIKALKGISCAYDDYSGTKQSAAILNKQIETLKLK